MALKEVDSLRLLSQEALGCVLLLGADDSRVPEEAVQAVRCYLEALPLSLLDALLAAALRGIGSHGDVGLTWLRRWRSVQLLVRSDLRINRDLSVTTPMRLSPQEATQFLSQLQHCTSVALALVDLNIQTVGLGNEDEALLCAALASMSRLQVRVYRCKNKTYKKKMVKN